jgi:hypothetical protein
MLNSKGKTILSHNPDIGAEILHKQVVIKWCSRANGDKDVHYYDLFWLYDADHRDALDSQSIRVDIKREKEKIKINIMLNPNEQ